MHVLNYISHLVIRTSMWTTLMCPTSALAQTEAVAAHGSLEGERRKRWSQYLSRCLCPFFLFAFLSSTSPGCLWTQPSPVVTMPGQAPPQVALGSTLGWQQLAGTPKPRCLRPNLELQSKGILNVNLLSHALIFSSSPQKAKYTFKRGICH